jgi:hypothetical protein
VNYFTCLSTDNCTDLFHLDGGRAGSELHQNFIRDEFTSSQIDQVTREQAATL